MVESQMQISPGTESLQRSSLIKAAYYHDNQSLLEVAGFCSQFSDDEPTKKKIDGYGETLEKIDATKMRLKMGNNGSEYVEQWEMKELNDNLMLLRIREKKLRKDLINFCLKTMETKGLLKKSITILQLKKLPLVLGGSSAHGPEEELEEGEVEFEEEY